MNELFKQQQQQQKESRGEEESLIYVDIFIHIQGKEKMISFCCCFICCSIDDCVNQKKNSDNDDDNNEGTQWYLIQDSFCSFVSIPYSSDFNV